MNFIDAFLLFMIYFSPVIVAFGRRMSRRWLLAVVCALTAWTLLGWVACAVWAFVGRGKKQIDRDAAVAERIARMERELAAQPSRVNITVQRMNETKEA